MDHERTEVKTELESIFHWDYSVKSPQMDRLYENAKRDQWNVSKDIDWSTPVDLEKGIFADGMIDGYGSPLYEKLDEKTKRELNIEFSCWRISQLLHGEEGAMLACSQLVDMVPTNDAKFFQCTQVVDEARHTEVLSRYLALGLRPGAGRFSGFRLSGRRCAAVGFFLRSRLCP